MKPVNVRWLRAVLIGLLVMAMLAPCALASTSVYINTSTKIYQSPSKSAKTAKVSASMKVSLESTSGSWGKITHKGKTAYIPLKYLTLVNPVKVYATASAKLYKSAGSGKLGTVSTGTELYLLGLDGSYARVQNSARTTTGYIKSAYLSKVKPSSSAGGSVSYSSLSSSGSYNGVYHGNNGSSSSLSVLPSGLISTTSSASISRIEYVIYVAQSLIGAPYAASHSNPPKTFDCAKFTYYCFGQAQKKCLKGSSKSQGYDDRYEKITSIGALKRGDLVFFDTVNDSDLCDHVGIYLGSGWFIHASSEAGMVIVSRLDSGYYNRTFSWGRRVFYD